LGCPVGELAHFVGDDRETAAGFTGTSRFDGGVERQEVGLVGNFLDQLDDAADFLGTALQAEHLFQSLARVAGELVQFRADGVYRFAAARSNAGGSECFLLLVVQALGQRRESLLRLRQRLPIRTEGGKQTLSMRCWLTAGSQAAAVPRPGMRQSGAISSKGASTKARRCMRGCGTLSRGLSTTR
jgi:hypothetical protein